MCFHDVPQIPRVYRTATREGVVVAWTCELRYRLASIPPLLFLLFGVRPLGSTTRAGFEAATVTADAD